MSRSVDEQSSNLELDKQLCFPLYAASRLIQRLYHPLLEPFGLTYPQYIVLMILWEDAPCPVSHIGRRALLNTNTLTPLLKRLQQQGLITRTRASYDERVVQIELTSDGVALRQKLECVPEQLYASFGKDEATYLDLKQKLDDLIGVLLTHEDASNSAS